MWSRPSRRKPKFQKGCLYVCQCSWAYLCVDDNHWMGPYWRYDSIERMHNGRFETFANVYSDNPGTVTWEWASSHVRGITMEELHEGYPDCGGWLERQAFNGRHSTP